MSEWKKYRLGDLGTFFGGVTTIKRDDYGFGTPFITYKNVYKNSRIDTSILERMNVKRNDIIKRNCMYGDIFFTASSETPDEVAMSSVLLDNISDLTFNGFCKRFRLHNFNTLIPEYARYLLRGEEFRNSAYEYANGDVRFNISQESLSKISINIPDLSTQTAIAEILSSLDDKIELNNKINQELENLAQTLFKQWFIDFEFPNENLEPYKSSGGEMVESELGEIPKGWELKYLCKELTIAYGKNLPTTKLEDSGYDVFGGNGIIGKYHSFLYEEPQVLIACRGAASGKIKISNRKSFVTNNSLIIEYKNSKIINFTYLKYWSLFQDFTKCVSGSAQPQITIENLMSNLILVPDVNIVNFFSETLISTLVRIENINSENNDLVKLRDTLLPKLISGELEINEIGN